MCFFSAEGTWSKNINMYRSPKEVRVQQDKTVRAWENFSEKWTGYEASTPTPVSPFQIPARSIWSGY
jgi:hypothetical protein